MSPSVQLDADSGRKPSVVIVDPEFGAYADLAVSARLGRMQLHLRSSGGEAVRLAKWIHVDAWLVAAELDDMSGHDLVALLKGKGGAGDAPVAMVVDATKGRRHTIDSTAALEAGADAAVAHPIDLADLERLLGRPSEVRARDRDRHVMAMRSPSYPPDQSRSLR